MKIGINLLWVRPGKNGGTESYIRNILDGLSIYSDQSDVFVLYVAYDNMSSFDKYTGVKNFEKRVCDVECASQNKRIVWENLHLSKLGIKDKLDVWFMPVYSRPYFMSKKIPIVTVIHDLQALHYPEYFSKFRNWFFRLMWKRDCKTSAKIITISQFCKDDILKHYKIAADKVEVIYNPIITEDSGLDFDILTQRYGISDRGYYYTVSSLAKHKNLITLLKAMEILKANGNKNKLVVSGVNVNAYNETISFIKKHELSDIVTFTGFINNAERDCLYDHAKAFVFPSIFEGFGMPPIEAMRRGIPTVTTRKTCIEEVTQGEAIYVDDPNNEQEWAYVMTNISESDVQKHDFNEYELEYITRQYNDLFHDFKKHDM